MHWKGGTKTGPKTGLSVTLLPVYPSGISWLCCYCCCFYVCAALGSKKGCHFYNRVSFVSPHLGFVGSPSASWALFSFLCLVSKLNIPLENYYKIVVFKSSRKSLPANWMLPNPRPTLHNEIETKLKFAFCGLANWSKSVLWFGIKSKLTHRWK